MKRSSLAVVLLAASSALAACTSGGEPAKAPSPSKWKGVLRYYPFEPGSQWSFMIHAAPGMPGYLKIDRVVAFDGTTAVIDSDKQRTYRVAPDGIVREPSGAYLLKWPIVLGDKWQGANGSTVEVTKTEEKVTVEAGVFEGCVETTEVTGGDTAGVLRTTFCPDVGPVVVELTEANTPPGQVPARLVGRRRAYGPPMSFEGGDAGK